MTLPPVHGALLPSPRRYADLLSACTMLCSLPHDAMLCLMMIYSLPHDAMLCPSRCYAIRFMTLCSLLNDAVLSRLLNAMPPANVAKLSLLRDAMLSAT